MLGISGYVSEISHCPLPTSLPPTVYFPKRSLVRLRKTPSPSIIMPFSGNIEGSGNVEGFCDMDRSEVEAVGI